MTDCVQKDERMIDSRERVMERERKMKWRKKEVKESDATEDKR